MIPWEEESEEGNAIGFRKYGSPLPFLFFSRRFVGDKGINSRYVIEERIPWTKLFLATYDDLCARACKTSLERFLCVSFSLFLR